MPFLLRCLFVQFLVNQYYKNKEGDPKSLLKVQAPPLESILTGVAHSYWQLLSPPLYFVIVVLCKMVTCVYNVVIVSTWRVVEVMRAWLEI